MAYPLAPVCDESCGGAEQILRILEQQFHSNGYETFVAACADSRAAGRVLATNSSAAQFEDLDYFCAAYKMIFGKTVEPLRKELTRMGAMGPTNKGTSTVRL